MKLTAQALELIQDELYPSAKGALSMPLPHVQSCLEMAMYLGFDVTANVARVNKESREHQIALLPLENHREILALLDKLAPNSTAKFESQFENLKSKIQLAIAD